MLRLTDAHPHHPRRVSLPGSEPETAGAAFSRSMGIHMKVSQVTSTEQIKNQLAQLPGLEAALVRAGSRAGGLPESIRRISVFDRGGKEHLLILKSQESGAADRTLRLYTQYLQPFQLNSPKVYGVIELEGQPTLVMDEIRHTPADWKDGGSYLRAVDWLIQKDRVSMQHFDAVKNLDCLGVKQYFGVEYWLAIFDKWRQDAPENRQAQAVWMCVRANRGRIETTIRELDEVGAQTVVHGDLHLGNILFADEESGGGLYVIDWTEPCISSVTNDLASLYDNAPNAVKSEILAAYRRQFDFAGFDEVFARAKLVRDIGYCAWMAETISGGKPEEIDPAELRRVVDSLLSALES